MLTAYIQLFVSTVSLRPCLLSRLGLFCDLPSFVRTFTDHLGF